MKRLIFLIIGLVSVATAQGEELFAKSPETKGLKTWKAVGPLALVRPADIDTPLNGYNITNPALHRTIAFQHLGNLGSPGISKIFSDRKERSNFMFFQPYGLYYTSPEDLLYYDTKKPYTNITYYNGGPTDRKQENVSGIFSVNVSHSVNMGMYGRWQNNYGSYNSQSTRNYNAGFFGSWMGKHNNLMANISFNGYENRENGGFTDTRYITDPKNTGDLDAYNIPTYFDEDVTSKLVNWNAYLNYKYNFGFYKQHEVKPDSVISTFVPVSSLIYTFRSESDNKKYNEDASGLTFGNTADSFYVYKGFGNTHNINNIETQDSVHYWEMTHTAGISLNEEFNTFGKFGVAGYLTYTHKEYGGVDHMNSYTDNPDLVERRKVEIDDYGADSLGRTGESVWRNKTKEKWGLGAVISKHQGEHLFYDFTGEYFFKDEKSTGSSYNIGGDISTRFNIGRNAFYAKVRAQHERYCPDYFEDHYYGNRISWENDFDNKVKTEIEGTIGTPAIFLYGANDSSFLSKIAPELGLSLKVNQTNLDNYIYFGTDAKPVQYGSNISISNVTIREQFKLWYLHIDNELTYQYTNADDDILSLPSWCWYGNFYIQTKPLFKVMTIQLGADVRYNSKYYAPAYMPATGMFYSQTEEEIGDYPYWDVYLNLHLKTFRFFVEYNHINNVWSNNHQYLTTPGYALDQDYIKLGVSVNFED